MGNEDLALQFWPPRSPDITPCDFFLVRVRKRSSFCTTSSNNLGWPKKPYHSCGKLSDSRHSSSGAEWIQLPSRCYPCSWRGEYWTSINFNVSIIKCNLRHSHTMYSSGSTTVWNLVHHFESPCTFQWRQITLRQIKLVQNLFTFPYKNKVKIWQEDL
jgi:hypothetical protein